MRSRYLCVSSLQVCPIYDMLQVLQVSLYTSFFLGSGFDVLLYCVCAFESDFYVFVF